jgi:ABC-type sugar transport system substrate-binding protein
MERSIVSMLLIACAASVIAAADARAREKITVGISNPNLAFPFAAALQKVGDDTCKALDINCISTDAAPASAAFERARPWIDDYRAAASVMNG